jgi:hypothetical protein
MLGWKAFAQISRVCSDESLDKCRARTLLVGPDSAGARQRIPRRARLSTMRVLMGAYACEPEQGSEPARLLLPLAALARRPCPSAAPSGPFRPRTSRDIRERHPSERVGVPWHPVCLGTDRRQHAPTSAEYFARSPRRHAVARAHARNDSVLLEVDLSHGVRPPGSATD